jgi:hypothetical protein
VDRRGAFGLFLDFPDAGSMYLGNIGKLIPDNMEVSIHCRQNLKSNINN